MESTTNESNSGTNLTEVAAGIMVKAVLPLLLVVAFAVYELFWREANGGDYWVLILGTIASVLTMSAYCVLVVVNPGRGLIPMLVVLLLSLAYIFGCYLFFYRGLWSLKLQFSGFSFTEFIKSLAFVLLGYNLVSKLYLLTEVKKSNECSK